MPDSIADVRIGDVLTFLAVHRSGSITAASRELKVTPSQVSKSVARLENQLRVTLLVRSSRGVTVTDAALGVVPHLEEIVTRMRRVGRRESASPQLTIAAPSYLTSFFIPRLVQRRPSLRLRSIELPPALVRAYATDNFFDIALTMGAEPFPATWVTTKIGDIRKKLFGAPALLARLGRLPISIDAARELMFIGPVYSVGGQFVPADDGCPLVANERKFGHETGTVTVALELAARSEQVVFAPAIAARAHVERRTLVEIPVRGWDVRDTLHLRCSGDRVRVDDQRMIVGALTSALAEA